MKYAIVLRMKLIINKNKLIELTKVLLAFRLASVMLGTAGCTICENENEKPSWTYIFDEFSNVKDYYKI